MPAEFPASQIAVRTAPRLAHWHSHINHVQAPRQLQHWLTDSGSLTAKLIAHSSEFRVQRISQKNEGCWADEYHQIGLDKPGKVHAREVLLRCDGQAAVYAHTILPMTSTATQWPLFRTLGNQSLGSTLFGDPRVVRGPIRYARLHHQHPAMQRAGQLTGHGWGQDEQRPRNPYLFARRSLFYRRGGVMLVTELFLPPIMKLTLKTSHAL